MGEFFRPLRRKIGVVTLVMACFVAAGWVRSGLKYDTFYFYSGNSMYRLFAYSGRLGLFHIIGRPKSDFTEGVSVYPDNVSVEFSIGKIQAEVGERREIIGFHFETGKVGNQSRYAVYTIPYWLMTLPLTALSAWLLLSRLPKSPPSKISEPVPIEGGT